MNLRSLTDASNIFYLSQIYYIDSILYGIIDLSEDQRQEHKLGTLLVSISVLFICCQSFKMIPDIYELIFCPPVEGKEQECETTPFISTCVSLSHLLVCGNSALNWIIYLLAGEKFRRVWRETYLPQRCRPKPLERARAQASTYATNATTARGCTTVEIRERKNISINYNRIFLP